MVSFPPLPSGVCGIGLNCREGSGSGHTLKASRCDCPARPANLSSSGPPARSPGQVRPGKACQPPRLALPPARRSGPDRDRLPGIGPDSALSRNPDFVKAPPRGFDSLPRVKGAGRVPGARPRPAGPRRLPICRPVPFLPVPVPVIAPGSGCARIGDRPAAGRAGCQVRRRIGGEKCLMSANWQKQTLKKADFASCKSFSISNPFGLFRLQVASRSQ